MADAPLREIAAPFKLYRKQCQLLDLVDAGPATWIGYGGSRGGAKSYGGRNVLLYNLMRPVDKGGLQGTRACIVRRTYELVRENHIERLLMEHPWAKPFYRVTDKEFRLPHGSVLAFRGMELKSDVDAMIGKEYILVLVDQAEAFTEGELNTFKSCVRWPGELGTRARMILTFNPGGVGNAFLKRIFIDRRYQGDERPEDYAFIQAYGWDNVKWASQALNADGLTEEDYFSWTAEKQFDYFITRTAYGKDLNAKPPAQRIGWLLGRFDKFAGQYFDVWNPGVHVKPCRPEAWHPKWIGIDWGFGHPSACYWGAQIAPHIFGVYREYITRGQSPRQLAQGIIDRTPEDERSSLQLISLSHDAFGKRDERDPIAVQMSDVFRATNFPTAHPAGRNPVASAALIYDMLRSGELVVSPDCEKLIETIPLITRDEDDPEKTIKFDGDDSYDGLRHLLHHRLEHRAMPREIMVRREAGMISDPIKRWMFLTRQLNRESSDVLIDPIVRPTWEVLSR